MSNFFRPLEHVSITPGTTLPKKSRGFSGRLSLTSSALHVMTDLNFVNAFSTTLQTSIDDANNKMIACGVRLLFVLDDAAGVIGVVTANDILGEKPLNYLTERGGQRDQIVVNDIMTPLQDLQAMPLEAARKASIGDIVATMQRYGRQHLLVIERELDGSAEYVRGIFSSTQITRQLGVEIKLTPRANTFAEIEHALAVSF